ncbi:MAG: tRNA (N(6)-L-threonylcarbamoyladenosine(37)-C(2))-methylthiotransferase MtaB [Thermodesulfobacteriota bacterium]|nr:tRNA (N(6)-L-threonylcarbamoyladenosine(37)-C(2))-methylthiotransferase MtaB [Thermodesulfobacteriota bacterium]
MNKAAITTLGCKVNKCDSAVIYGLLKRSGYDIVPFHQRADIYIINTCTVTQRADYQSRQLIKRSYRLNPSARIIVTGCYAQRAPQDIKAIPGVDHVVGIGDVGKLVRAIECPSERDVLQDTPDVATVLPEHTRAFLKVQDGCDSYCSYCVIPHTRGKSRSVSQEEIMRQILRLTESGYKEIVLTGIHLGAYGFDLRPSTNLTNLIRSMDEKSLPCRIRLSSIEPMEFNDDLIDIISSSPTICNHLHIPLQSGDDGILKRMRRPYDSIFFKEQTARLISAIPDLNIGLDVIVGFPGETEENFENTVRFIEDLPIGYLHIFPYSRRPGTPAADFSHQVDSRIIKERARIMRRLGNKKKEEFYMGFHGKVLSVLIESKREKETGFLKGFSQNYIPVLVETGDNNINKEIPITVTQVRDGRVFGNS